jgi:hypothetical protein
MRSGRSALANRLQPERDSGCVKLNGKGIGPAQSTDSEDFRDDDSGRDPVNRAHVQVQPMGPRGAEPTHPPRPAPGATMPFRIVGHHQHRAVVDGHTYCCIRETTATDAGLLNRWSAYRDNTLLKGDCRTLNEAKQLCRAAAGEAIAPTALDD